MKYVRKGTLNDILIKLGKKELCLTEKNKEVLDEFVILLCLFNEATILTQADQTIAISVVESILLNLLSDLELERKKSERIYLLCDALISSLKTRKQYIVDACMKLTSKEKIVNADVQIITEENGSNKTTTIFSDKENKKRLFPSLQMGSFKRAKLDNSKPKSVLIHINLLISWLIKLCVPATSAPIERVFSQSGLLMRPHRSRFSQGNICIL
ncbi:unnamed protein product [Rotaria sp. Silwood1]|nr:unnamed protein product [Rotaria sp. Silwood1]